jgi:hypothetical protein
MQKRGFSQTCLPAFDFLLLWLKYLSFYRNTIHSHLASLSQQASTTTTMCFLSRQNKSCSRFMWKFLIVFISSSSSSSLPTSSFCSCIHNKCYIYSVLTMLTFSTYCLADNICVLEWSKKEEKNWKGTEMWEERAREGRVRWKWDFVSISSVNNGVWEIAKHVWMSWWVD